MKTDSHRPVIENIRSFAQSGEFHRKVEIHDPALTPQEIHKITDNYLSCRTDLTFRAKTAVARALASVACRALNRDTDIIGLDRITLPKQSFIITSNHFSPMENTVIRLLTKKLGKRLSIVCQATNFAMPGLIGFLMNYGDTIPLSVESHYLARDFLSVLKEKLAEKNQAILLYPEQEMWYRYRKPRPPKSGAYFYAAKLGAPILSCFVEIQEKEEDQNEEFKKVRCILHVLGTLSPDPDKSVKENTERLAQEDYALKKACYERVYHKPLTYDFEPWDIAGWKNP